MRAAFDVHVTCTCSMHVHGCALAVQPLLVHVVNIVREHAVHMDVMRTLCNYMYIMMECKVQELAEALVSLRSYVGVLSVGGLAG